MLPPSLWRSAGRPPEKSADTVRRHPPESEGGEKARPRLRTASGAKVCLPAAFSGSEEKALSRKLPAFVEENSIDLSQAAPPFPGSDVHIIQHFAQFLTLFFRYF